MSRALVMGDIDLVRPLGMAGVRSTLFSLPDERARHSRHVDEVLPWIDHWRRPEAVVDALLAWSARQPARPALYFQTDGDLLVVSRHRERLEAAFRFVLADAELVEDLVDKERFIELAARHGLPLPRTLRARAGQAVGLDFPVVVKPLTRRMDEWRPVASSAKAVRVASAEELHGLWERLGDLEVLVQEEIPGPESRIESYHAYVDASGEVAAEFTGRKIRTYPRRFGVSTAVETTDAPEVAELGRELYARIGLRGVAKADFKRDARGALRLLEINPRFTLWHHPAAAAGVNVPAVVHADLTSSPRPAPARARPGVRWCDPLEDVRAAREQGIGLGTWIRFAAACETRSGLAVADPAPWLREELLPLLTRRLGRS